MVLMPTVIGVTARHRCLIVCLPFARVFACFTSNLHREEAFVSNAAQMYWYGQMNHMLMQKNNSCWHCYGTSDATCLSDGCLPDACEALQQDITTQANSMAERLWAIVLRILG